MATSSLYYFALLFIISIFSSSPTTTTTTAATSTFNLLSPTPTPTPTASHHDLHDHSISSHSALLGPILSHLGYNELSMAAPSLSSDPAVSAWSGPYTLFAPSDSSLRSCLSCSIPDLLREHTIPGLFTIDYLRKLAFGTKIESLSPGRCITITSAQNDTTVSKVFVGGVEITHPDLFNNGLVIIHGIQGYVAPLSPFSCDFERFNALSMPFHHHPAENKAQPLIQPPPMMRPMLRDAIFRLRNNGFSILSLAMKIKYAELADLTNLTVFALDDVSIFSGSHSYISSIRFHMVPNRFLPVADLDKLPVGTTLTTLERGQSLVVTSAGGGFAAAPMRINHVRLKVPEVMRNLKIVVHSVYLPFPRIHPTAAAASLDGILGAGAASDVRDHASSLEGACSVLTEDGGNNCGLLAPPAPVPVVPPHRANPTVETLDHGL